MTKLRLVLLATTALTAMQCASLPSHAQTAPQVMAQAKEELGPDGKPKREAPKGAPPAAAPKAAPPAAPPAAAPPPRPTPPPAPPAAAPPRPAPPPPPAAPKAPTPPSAGQPKEQFRERERTGPPPGQTPPPAAAPPPAGGGAGTPPTGRPGGQPPTGAPPAPNAIPAPAAPGGQQGAAPSGAAPLARRAPPTVTTPLPPPPPPAQALAPAPQGAAPQGPRRMEDFRGQRQESDQGGRRVFTEPGRVIVVDPSGQSFIRHNEEDRFRFGARDIQTQQVGGETRTVVIRPDGSQVITVVGRDGQLLRRLRRDREGREIIIIDNSYRDPRAVGGFYVDLPPPVIRIPYDRYIVEADVAPPELLYDTMLAPPVGRINRRVTIRRITPLLNGGTASLPPPPPGTAPPR